MQIVEREGSVDREKINLSTFPIRRMLIGLRYLKEVAEKAMRFRDAENRA